MENPASESDPPCYQASYAHVDVLEQLEKCINIKEIDFQFLVIFVEQEKIYAPDNNEFHQESMLLGRFWFHRKKPIHLG